MDRRAFIAGGVALVATPLAVKAQQPTKVIRIGHLLTGSLQSPEVRASLDAFRQGMRDLGYVEGQTIALEYRLAAGKEERFSDLASELVHLKVDVIFATVAAAVRAAQHATKTIPIVTVVNDPVAAGFVASVARPGETSPGCP